MILDLLHVHFADRFPVLFSADRTERPEWPNTPRIRARLFVSSGRIFFSFYSHPRRLILRGRVLFTKWDKAMRPTERRWVFGCWCPGIRCKDTAGMARADHLTVKRETDSSWKANEHVSAIWKSHPKHYPSSALRQGSHFTSPKSFFFTPSSFFVLSRWSTAL